MTFCTYPITERDEKTLTVITVMKPENSVTIVDIRIIISIIVCDGDRGHTLNIHDNTHMIRES